VNRAYFGTHQLTAADFTPVLPVFNCHSFVINTIHQAQQRARVDAKTQKHRSMRQAAAAGTATQHELNLLAVMKAADWERSASYA
jgi:hypothetical protein